MQFNAIDLHAGAEQGTLTKWQMVLVVCFAPGRVNEPKGYVSAARHRCCVQTQTHQQLVTGTCIV